jgi:hypothetical protein
VIKGGQHLTALNQRTFIHMKGCDSRRSRDACGRCRKTTNIAGGLQLTEGCHRFSFPRKRLLWNNWRALKL